MLLDALRHRYSIVDYILFSSTILNYNIQVGCSGQGPSSVGDPSSCVELSGRQEREVESDRSPQIRSVDVDQLRFLSEGVGEGGWIALRFIDVLHQD